MSERLAVKTDQVEAWVKGKIGPVVKSLTPRPTDNGRKSAWAHCADDNGELSDVLQDPGKATCRLQALAMYIFSELHSLTRRNRITGVSLLREAIQEHLVMNEGSLHPVRSYSVTHRSLLMADEVERNETASHLLRVKAFEPWEYTRDEMAELLETLLIGGHIEPEMQEDALSLLRQWTS